MSRKGAATPQSEYTKVDADDDLLGQSNPHDLLKPLHRKVTIARSCFYEIYEAAETMFCSTQCKSFSEIITECVQVVSRAKSHATVDCMTNKLYCDLLYSDWKDSKCLFILYVKICATKEIILRRNYSHETSTLCALGITVNTKTGEFISKN